MEVALAATTAVLALFRMDAALGDWSDAPGRALVEFDRALLYLVMLAFLGLHARGPGHSAVLLRWVGLAIAARVRGRAGDPFVPRHVPHEAGRQRGAARCSRSPTGTHGDVRRARGDAART